MKSVPVIEKCFESLVLKRDYLVEPKTIKT